MDSTKAFSIKKRIGHLSLRHHAIWLILRNNYCDQITKGEYNENGL